MEKTLGARGKRLKELLLRRIRTEGPIPFSQFMEWCLYHPDYGYYSAGPEIGKDGDYYTSPSVHPLFGHLLAKQLLQMCEILNEEGEEPFEVIEMAPGRGFLCQDILEWAERKSPPFYDRLKYYLVDRSHAFFREQEQRLSWHEKAGKLTWRGTTELFEQEQNIRGCILSNELVDAFPVHRLTFHEGRWKEIYVEEGEGGFLERCGELSDPRLETYFNGLELSPVEGQTVEVSLQALEWITKVARSLQKGFVMTIDYGFPAHELYAPHRLEGTFRCYFRNRISQNPYERLGEQDMTSHVNFTVLMEKGEAEGLKLTGFVPQYRFLLALGLLDELSSQTEGLSETEALQLRLSAKHWIDPDLGMGEAMKVLIQHKGIENPRLDGLRDLDAIEVAF